MKKHTTFIFAAVAVLAAALAFLPSLRNRFVTLDDNLMLLDAPVIRSLAAENIRHIFTSYHCWLYHPLVLLSYAVEYHFFGFNPFIFHLTNYLLHLANTGLVFAVFLALTRHRFLAGIVALLFGIHPLHVASVAWVSERKDVLYALFFLFAWWSYLQYRLNVFAGKKALRWYAAASFCFLLSLLSKPAAVILPAVLFLSDMLLMRRPDRRAYIDKVPLLLLSLIFSWVASRGFYGGGFGVPHTTVVQSILSSAYAMIFYIGKLILPIRLSCVYPLIEWQGIPPTLIMLAPALVALLIAVAAFDARRGRAIFFGVGLYLVMLAPILARVFSGLRQVADWYVYLPSLGLFFIVAEFLAAAARSYFRSVALALAVVAVAFGYLSWQRCGVWHDSVAVWNDVLEKYPALEVMERTPALYPNAKVACKNRGLVCAVDGKFDTALADLTAAVRLDPGYAEAYLHRASVYRCMADTAAALTDLHAALRSDARNAEAASLIADIQMSLGNIAAARLWHDRAVSFNAVSVTALTGRAAFRTSTGDQAGALHDLDTLVAAAPFSADAVIRRGVLLAGSGRHDEAGRDFDTAIRRDTRLAHAYANRGNIFAIRADYARAILSYTKAITYAPRAGNYFLSRAAAFHCAGDQARARADAETARRLGEPVDEKLFGLRRDTATGGNP